MMWTDFGSDVDAAFLPPADELDRPKRAHVGEMDMTPGPAREENVADDHDLFGLRRNSLEAEPRAHDALVHRAAACQRRFLAMIDHGDSEAPRIFQCSAHELGADHRLAIVTHRNRAGCHHLAEFGESLPSLSDRDRAD